MIKHILIDKLSGGPVGARDYYLTDKEREIIVDSVAKQIPKAPTRTRYGFPTCPYCGGTAINWEAETLHDYCPSCGQRIDWGCDND